MEKAFYEIFGVNVKGEECFSELCDSTIGEVDRIIADLMRDKFGVDMDFYYTTNVGIIKSDRNTSKTILWDVSFWSFYKKFLEFVYWMEREGEHLDTYCSYPSEIRHNALHRKSKADSCRSLLLGSIFEYLSYKFYSDETLSYCFAAFHNEHYYTSIHKVTDQELNDYNNYIFEQLLVTKLFCAFHEGFHLRAVYPPGDFSNYRQRILTNLKTLTNNDDFQDYYGYDIELVKSVRERISAISLNENPKDLLFDELYSDAGALDWLDIMLNGTNIFPVKWSITKFADIVFEAIDNFYAYNTLTYEIYNCWFHEMRLFRKIIDATTYRDELDKQNTEEVIRSRVFPVILVAQIESFLEENGIRDYEFKNRRINIRQEMINIFDLAYNDLLKQIIPITVEMGFREERLSISEARDILVRWRTMQNYPNISTEDLFLKGNTKYENDFHLFVRRY